MMTGYYASDAEIRALERQEAAGDMMAAKRYRHALTEIIRLIDHEQPLGNGFRIREVARVALTQ